MYRVPGRGTFVTENSGRYLRHLGSIEDLMNLSRDTTMEVVSPLQRRVDIEAASRLRLDTDVVYTVVFRRIHEGVPFVQTTAHLPEAIARQIIDLPAMAAGAVSANTVIGLLEPLIDSPIVEAAQSITVSPATADVARDVDCEIGHAHVAGGPFVLQRAGRCQRVVGELFLAGAVHVSGHAAPRRTLTPHFSLLFNTFQERTMRIFNGIDEVETAVGEHLGYSAWFPVTQDRIDKFADATEDHQWIHVEPERAAQGPYGGTIAHGYLTLSLLPVLGAQVMRVDGISMTVNYGSNKVRFPEPVKVGSSVRGRCGDSFLRAHREGRDDSRAVHDRNRRSG